MALSRMAVAIPTIVPHGLLNRCMVSLMVQHHITADTLIIQNGPRVALVCTYWECQGVSVYRPGRNIGVSASWNYACRWAWARSHGAVLLLNDDLALTDPLTLMHFATAVTAQPRSLYYLGARGFSAVCITKIVWDEVGEFDEGFWPAYHEDNDMHRRMKLVGIPWSDINLSSEHFGSAAIRSDAEMNAFNGITFPLNQARYVAKWGGLPEHETYTVPWNGGPPSPSVQELVEHQLAS